MKSSEKHLLPLGEAVPKYHIAFRMQPGVATVVSGRIAHMIFRLELSGRHDHSVRSDRGSCPDCIYVLQSLFDVTDTLRSAERATLNRVGGACEVGAHYASTTGPRHEVTLGLEMKVRPPLAATSDSWAWIFTQSIRGALKELGCRSRAFSEPVGCRLVYPSERRGQVLHGGAIADRSMAGCA
jgi:hypothetical protein